MTEINEVENNEKKGLNFVEQIVADDLQAGKNGGQDRHNQPCHLISPFSTKTVSFLQYTTWKTFPQPFYENP